MPRVVDHEKRRGEIADAVSRIAGRRGLRAVSFRQVAREAGMSVSLVQHYFGSKENLLVRTLEIQSSRYAAHIAARLSQLPPDEPPLSRLRVMAASFIPADDESRAAMTLYHAFAGAALTDPKLRTANAFRNADSLVDAMTEELSRARCRGERSGDVDPSSDATAILSLVLGLSLATLLEQATVEEALAVLDGHLARLRLQYGHSDP